MSPFSNRARRTTSPGSLLNSCPWASSSKAHGVSSRVWTRGIKTCRFRILGLIRHSLGHVPMLHDPTMLIEGENIDSSPDVIGRPLLAAMQVRRTSPTSAATEIVIYGISAPLFDEWFL